VGYYEGTHEPRRSDRVLLALSLCDAAVNLVANNDKNDVVAL